MRTRMYGGVRGRKTKVGGKPTFVFLLLDYWAMSYYLLAPYDLYVSVVVKMPLAKSLVANGLPSEVFLL